MVWAPVLRLSMIVTSVMSALGALSVIVTYLKWPAMREKKYYEILFYISISIFLTSIGSSFGIVRDGGFLCWFQGIVTNVFSLSAIFWTVLITCSLNYVVVYAKLMRITVWMHLFCWLFPVFVSLLPLIHVRYGSKGKQWCFFQQRNESFPDSEVVLWTWLGFYLWVFGSVIAIILIILSVLNKGITAIVNKEVFQVMLKKLKYYPIVIVVCWVPASIYDSAFFGREFHESHLFDFIVTTLACLHGFLFSLIFWMTNPEVIGWWLDDGKRTSSVNSSGVANKKQLFDNYGNEDFFRETVGTDLREPDTLGEKESVLNSISIFRNPMANNRHQGEDAYPSGAYVEFSTPRNTLGSVA